MVMRSKTQRRQISRIYRNKHVFVPKNASGKDLGGVNSAKILRLIISSNLRCNNLITESTMKANLRLFFLVLRIRAGVLSEDLNNFSCVAVWPVLQYRTRVFHHALPLYLSSETERAYKKSLSNISLDLPYKLKLKRFYLSTLCASAMNYPRTCSARYPSQPMNCLVHLDRNRSTTSNDAPFTTSRRCTPYEI